jgi:transposase-like protein
MLAERGLDISHETVRRWFLKFGSAIAANLRRSRSRPSDHWHLDEMVVVIRVRATPSIFSATSTDDPFTKNFEPHHSMFGKPRVLPPDHRSLSLQAPAAKFM